MMIERLNRPTAAVVDLAEAKNHVRVDGDFEDPDFARMIGAAAREAEELAQLALLNQQIRVILPCWPRSLSFALPVAPLLDWSSVTMTADGVPFDNFSVVSGHRPTLRVTEPRPVGEVIIDYQAGFGPDPSDVPDDLRHALLDQVAAYYDARANGDPKVASLSPHFARIVGRYRGVRL